MSSEQIKRAIEVLKDSMPECGVYSREITNQAFELAIECMEKEIDRQENKALTLRELEEMVGEPVYMITQSGSDWIVMSQYHLINLEKSSKEFGAEFGLIQFYKHKPTEGVGR